MFANVDRLVSTPERNRAYMGNSKFSVGNSTVAFEPERSVAWLDGRRVGTLTERCVTLYFYCNKGEITQALADKATQRVLRAKKIVVSQRQVVIYHPDINSQQDALDVAAEVIDEFLAILGEREKHVAEHHAAKAGSRSGYRNDHPLKR